APALGLSATSSSELLVPSLAAGSFPSSASISARASSRRLSMPPSAHCCCCWSSDSFAAEADGVGEEEGGEEIGEDVGSRRPVEAKFRGHLEGRLFGGQTWNRRTIESTRCRQTCWRGPLGSRS